MGAKQHDGPNRHISKLLRACMVSTIACSQAALRLHGLKSKPSVVLTGCA
jgi:hypothetical protein